MRVTETHEASAGAAAPAATGYPLVLDGADLAALIVGGGEVAVRKAEALHAAGARIRIIAASASERCRALAAQNGVSLEERELDESGIGREIDDAMLVIAATDSADLNARIAETAKRMRRLVNVADAPSLGNCVTPATHRADGLVVAVAAGGVPAVAVRIRDAIASRFDGRFAAAIATLGALRERLLREGRRTSWREASEALVGDDFCESVERGTFAERVARWR